MKPILDFDDPGATDGYPAKGVTIEDIRAWHDEFERMRSGAASLTTALADVRERAELLQHRVAERDRAALIAAAQLDAEVRRAEDAHGEAQRWALEVERLHELTYAPDGKEYRSMVFEELAKRLPLQEEVEQLRRDLSTANAETIKTQDDLGRHLHAAEATSARFRDALKEIAKGYTEATKISLAALATEQTSDGGKLSSAAVRVSLS